MSGQGPARPSAGDRRSAGDAARPLDTRAIEAVAERTEQERNADPARGQLTGLGRDRREQRRPRPGREDRDDDRDAEPASPGSQRTGHAEIDRDSRDRHRHLDAELERLVGPEAQADLRRSLEREREPDDVHQRVENEVGEHHEADDDEDARAIGGASRRGERPERGAPQEQHHEPVRVREGEGQVVVRREVGRHVGPFEPRERKEPEQDVGEERGEDQPPHVQPRRVPRRAQRHRCVSDAHGVPG